MKPTHLNLGCIQGGLVDESFPRSQVGLTRAEQGLLEEDPIEAPAPLEFNWIIDHLAQDAHGDVVSPAPRVIPTVLEDGLREGNLTVLEAGQVPHHRSGEAVKSITDEGSSLERHDAWYTTNDLGNPREPFDPLLSWVIWTKTLTSEVHVPAPDVPLANWIRHVTQEHEPPFFSFPMSTVAIRLYLPC